MLRKNLHLIALILVVVFAWSYRANARPAIHDILAKGSEWRLNVDGEKGLLKLLGGRGSRPPEGGWEMTMEVEWQGNRGVLRANADGQNSKQQVFLELISRKGARLRCEGYIALWTDKLMAGTTQYGAKTSGSWFATKSQNTQNMDKRPPKLSIFHTPPKPTPEQKVTFTVRATDDRKLKDIEILVNGKPAKKCLDSPCTYIGGPYPAGTVNYGANAFDQAGNRAWSGYHDVAVKKPLISVRPPSSNATNTLTGRVTGEKQFVKAIGVYDANSRKFLFEISVGQNGEFKSRKVQAGNYKLRPLPRGKFDLICSPREKSVMCRKNQTKNADFHITGIFEG